ncbi:hypothetical protein GGR21_003807 [Dysgonomonas hofstadii]|uniref:Uncharacterized protein n=1 Tax=Dysgonomonas hofstadii TaxID=637886 RepID=A0A840CR36_9BACT|nr:hypothetical protein [Dysgonomonas hofstadii]
MKKCHLRIISILLISFLFTSTWAQVTVGMGEAPTKTALLQIKSQAADANNVTSKTGGFLPPRVELVKLKTLQPFMQPTDEGYNDEKKASVGLLVYNVATIEADSISPGFYYWDGEQWDMLTARSNSGGGNNGSDTIIVEPIPTDPTDPSALDLSNCYIVNPGQTVKIPVMKAYAVWAQKLQDNEIQDAVGDRSMNLVWQDAPGVVQYTPIIADAGSQSTFAVTGLKPGNAVIAYTIGGITYWSWHIWVTDYDPETEYKSYNGLQFMDRCLGATNATFGALGAMGLLYQWGRKDPFPGAATTTSSTEKVLYSYVDMIHPTVTKSDISTLPVTYNNNLRASIKAPLTFYYSNGSLGDWYTANTSNSDQDDNLWYDENLLKKTPYDPCPPGWRVAYVDTPGDTPFANLPVPGNFSDGTGIDGVMGYTAAAGYRDPKSGDFATFTNPNNNNEIDSYVGIEGHVWNATIGTNSHEYQAYNLYFKPYTLLANQLQARASGCSVRCVKDLHATQ